MDFNSASSSVSVISKTSKRMTMEGTFTFMGMSVTNLAKLFGGILVVWGIIAYFMQSSDPPLSLQ